MAPRPADRGPSSRFETWAYWLVPLLLAALAVGGWFAWRWWTEPGPFVYEVF
jgi:paraquat-inducible protein B